MPHAVTGDGFEKHFGVNYVAHFALFQALQGTLLASSTPDFPSRVVMVSSMIHAMSTFSFEDYNYQNTPYDEYMAYGASKTATIWMANEIERRFGSQGLHATSVHPGAVLTEKLASDENQAEVIAQSPEMAAYLKSIAQGAATPVWAAVGKEWGSKGGRYLAEMAEEKPLDASATGLIKLGYAPHAYDEEAEGRLWHLGLKLIGEEDKQ